MTDADLRASCRQPLGIDGSSCEDTGYCLCRIYADAKDRCIAKGEGWRWGVGKPPQRAA